MGFGVPRHSTVEVFDGGCQQSQGVAFHLGEIDDQLSVQHGLGKGEGKSITFQLDGWCLLEADNLHLLFATDRSDSRQLQYGLQIGGTGRTVPHADVRGTCLLQETNGMTQYGRMCGDRLFRRSVRQQIRLNQNTFSTQQC